MRRFGLALVLFAVGAATALWPLASARAQNSSLGRSRWQPDEVTGTVIRHDQAVPVALAVSRRIELPISSVTTPAASVASDLNQIITADELMNSIDSDVRKRTLISMPLQAGFYEGQNNFYAQERDRRVGRPWGNDLSPEEEIAVRKNMARMVQQYMIFKGLPKFLASREDTKPLAKVYGQAMGYTRIKLQSTPKKPTEVPWDYSFGVDPFPTDRVTAWTSASNDVWSLELRQSIHSLNGTEVAAQRELKLGRHGKWIVSSRYYRQDDLMKATILKPLTPNLTVSAGWKVPVRSPHRWAETIHTVAMSYAF